MESKQNNKIDWIAPTLETLNIESTLGGTTWNPSECRNGNPHAAGDPDYNLHPCS